MTHENYVTARVDHTISNKDSVFGTFLYDASGISSPDEFNNKNQVFDVGRKLAMIEETHIFSPQAVNSARFGFYRVPADIGATTAVNPAAADLSLGTVPGRAAPDVGIAGVTEFTGGVGAPSHYNFHFNSFQFYDDVFYTRGAHSIKFGGSANWIQDNITAVTDGNGAFNYGSLASFLTNESATTFKAFIPSVLSGRSIHQTLLGAYVQDDWRAKPNLTVNLGLRYEMATVPYEPFGRLSVLKTLTAPTPFLGNPTFSNPTLHDFEPRVGFSWDPFHNGKTAIRGGFGVYDALPLTYMFNLVGVFTAPYFEEGVANNLPPGSFGFPGNTFNLLGLAGLRQSFYDPNPKRSYVFQYTLNVQRQLAPNLAVMLGYIGSGADHDPFRTEDADMVLPTLTPQGYAWPLPIGSGTKLNPNAGLIRALLFSGRSTYNALEAQITKTMSHGLQVQGSYTWSKGIDDGSAPAVGDTFNNSIPGLFWFDNSLNRGVSDFALTQTLEINGVWDAPSPKFGPSTVRWALGGWQVGGIFTASSGVPFTPLMGGDPLGQLSEVPFDVPNRVPGSGCGTPVNSGNVNNYMKLQCYAAPTALNIRGDSGRNSVWGPPQRNFDFSLVKNNYVKKISESFNVQFRAEFFNLFNLAEFQPPIDNSTLFDQNGLPIGGAGEIDTTSTSQREIQFALKVIW
ncbi:MAG: hypothetical protein ACRD1J_07400 [Terriglobia bacterium]